MTELQAIVLGIIQGLTEFLPVSSSGHLIFIPKIFGWGDQGLAFDAVVHLGTLLAVVVYFRKRLWKVLESVLSFDKEKWKTGNGKLGWLILLTIIPAGLVGLFFGDLIENTLRETWIVGVGLIFWGVVLGMADKFSRKSSVTSLNNLSWKKTLFIGCAQAIALIPGTSRSGITMTAGLFSKLSKKDAAEFSFLMSVPIILLGGGLKVVELFGEGLGSVQIIPLVIGFLASALSGFVAIAGLMKIVQKWSFMPFVAYRIVVGVLILIFLT